MANKEGRSSEGQVLSKEIAEYCGCVGRRSSSGDCKSQQTAEGASCFRSDGNRKPGAQLGMHTGSIYHSFRQPEQCSKVPPTSASPLKKRAPRAKVDAAQGSKKNKFLSKEELSTSLALAMS